uniref:DNA-directed RNA polymerase n=1 Tax=Candidatus Methanogaster sp. ANME-2c ERB4 TaxID=2759911 RepID=A0A7G9YQ15_9EURY|nr:hypothetical protein DMFPCFDI_00032 [Methanosarcinales archaeon ANME-2c ERB4]QNO50099.1 hypothetical protein GDOAKEED_00003 [Methanosarcinales archaeon ANME-2c ERB4]
MLLCVSCDAATFAAADVSRDRHATFVDTLMILQARSEIYDKVRRYLSHINHNGSPRAIHRCRRQQGGALQKKQEDATTLEQYTRYERARIIGARALQISLGAPVLIRPDTGDPIDIALRELEEGVLPITVKR